MKNGWLITFRSITFAQKGERTLKQRGVACTMRRTPKGLSERGCSYCLQVTDDQISEALTVLRDQNIAFGNVYAPRADGWEARSL